MLRTPGVLSEQDVIDCDADLHVPRTFPMQDYSDINSVPKRAADHVRAVLSPVTFMHL